MRSRSRAPLSAVLLLCLAPLGSTAIAEESDNNGKQIDFARDVEPIFKRHCLACHGPKKQESQFRLDVRAALLAGGDLGEAAVVPGKSAESNLIKLVSGVDPDFVMPPEGERLTAEQVAVLRAWIDQGAKMPQREVAKMTTDHWSFSRLPVRRRHRLIATGPPARSMPSFWRS